jgi:CheY-like chemotaxis protein
MSKAIEIASPLLEQRGHRLTIDVPGQGLSWRGDPVRLAQVVANLLTNAARYTNRGGTIRLAAFSEGVEVVISVQDNGSGISPEMLPKLFELFTQAKRNAVGAEGGLGIGLALVKNLVAMHGGTVVAHSEGLGKGSEFVIRLPKPTGGLAPSEQPPASTRAASEFPGPAQRVLVVDDNVDAAELLGEFLRKAGHAVAIANDAAAALALLQQFNPEVAVLDIGLPVMDGYELGLRIRAQGANCRLIALTGYGQVQDRVQSKKAGFECHLVKPMDLDRLAEIVAQASVTASDREKQKAPIEVPDHELGRTVRP